MYSRTLSSRPNPAYRERRLDNLSSPRKHSVLAVKDRFQFRLAAPAISVHVVIGETSTGWRNQASFVSCHHKIIVVVSVSSFARTISSAFTQ